MELEFTDPDLEKLATEAGFRIRRLSEAVENAYKRRIQTIVAALDERDLYAMKSLHFEKLKGNRSHQRSMRLNDQFRLILEIRESELKNVIVIVAIEDYH